MLVSSSIDIRFGGVLFVALFFDGLEKSGQNYRDTGFGRIHYAKFFDCIIGIR